MLWALLEREDGFSKRIEWKKFSPEIRVPIYEKIHYPHDDTFLSDVSRSRFLLFRFEDWIDAYTARYKELPW